MPSPFRDASPPFKVALVLGVSVPRNLHQLMDVWGRRRPHSQLSLCSSMPHTTRIFFFGLHVSNFCWWPAFPPSCSAEFKGNRQHMAFRFNVFQHLGSVSTLRGKISPDYPKCFEELTIQTLFEVSAVVVVCVRSVLLVVLRLVYWLLRLLLFLLW